MGKLVKEFRHVTAGVEELEGPELLALLERNRHNRPPTPSHITHMAGQMPREWRLTGEPIIIGSDGSLLDGQNRCRAALEAGCSLVTMVVRGVDPKAFRAMGTGKPRSLADVLGIKGEVSRASLASAVSWLWRYENGGMLRSAKAAGLSNERGDKFLAKHPGLRESLQVVSPHWGRDVGLSSGHGTLHYLYSRLNDENAAEMATEFFHRMSPEGHRTGLQSAPNVLVTWLIKNVVRGARKAHKQEVMAVSVKAMRAWFEGKRVSRLAWITTGPRAEDFPPLLAGMKSKGVRHRILGA